MSAADSFPAFAHGGTEAEGRREIAAFFAHVTYETGCKSPLYRLYTFLNINCMV